MANCLQQFKNHLSYSQIADGMNAASENARRLVEDAQILFDSQRYPSAASLAILAIEESGKSAILREMATARDGKALKAGWKSYRSHTKKNVAWILPELAIKGARKLEEFDQIAGPQGDHPEILDSLKQIGFYTDCLGNAHWSVPSAVIDESTAKSILSVAQILSKKRVHTEREIELWVAHVAPVKESQLGRQKEAVYGWFKAMEAEGLIEEGEIPFAEFLDIQESYNQ
ncbi:AbiV family abortive infection protein [Guyparkeria hydrothermalis]|uniref:AbiV family abortive infection protein n=1 Tax=Guyparkeria hydrothermalis TaxID=923 RepID=UPI002020715F|nr:AbiV family abortive infection protein [Guyparkeria hydrothermalis]MCL7744843.1 AbiV family abortive infection protein [Guyparkeria hydrothermalis]